MYRVIRHFTDLQDGGHKYLEGAEYPRKGYRPSEDRIAELSGASNKQGVPLIRSEAPLPVKKAKKRKG